MPNERRDRRVLLLLFFAAVFLRGAYVLAMAPDDSVSQEAFGIESFGDQIEYRSLASNMLSSGRFTSDGIEPQINRMPGFPALLAVFEFLFNSTATPMHVLNVVLAGALVFIVYALARPLFGPRTALLAAGLTLVYPGFLFYTTFELTEIVYTFIFSLAMLCVLRFLQSRRWQWFAATLALFLPATYIRGETLLLAGVLILVAACSRRAKFPHKWRYLSLAILVLLLGMLPWTVRNVLAAGYYSPLEALGGPHGLWYVAHTSFMSVPDILEYKRTHFSNLTTLEKRERVLREWKELFKTRPSAYPLGVLSHARGIWLDSHTIANRQLSRLTFREALAAGSYGLAVLKALLFVITVGLGALGLAGIIVFRTRPYVVLLAIPILFKWLVHALLGAEIRYQIPIMPFVIVLAAALIIHVVTGLRHARRSPRAA